MTREVNSQLPNGNYFLTHPHRYGSSATKTPRPFRQCHSGGHCEQHHQTTAFAINGNEIFWMGDKVAQEMYALKWHPGKENLANYQSKHHIGSHHAAVRPWYLHLENSPRILPRAERPSALKGCVGTLKDAYVRNVPLPRAPQIQHASHTGHVTHNACYLAQVPRIPTWSDLTKSLAGLGRRALLPFSLVLM
jgi:hypothetical protein